MDTGGKSGLSRKRPFPLVLYGAPNSYEDKGNDFLCPICFEIIEEAHVTKCGHTFCYKCITTSLERNHRCPKCNLAIEAIFPNFLLNELITKYHKDALQRKIDASRHNPRELNELQELLLQKAEQLELPDVNQLLQMLAQKKQRMEETSIFVRNELLKDFLALVRKHKQEQLDQLTRELALIDEDQKQVASLISATNPPLGKSNTPTGEATPTPGTGSKNLESPSLDITSFDQPSSSTGTASSSDAAFNRNISSTAINSLGSRRNKMNVHFEELEDCYFEMRAKTLRLSKAEEGPDALNDFSETLNKFTLHSSLRPLATLTYTSDPFSGSSIVSSIEFGKDNDFFAIAGVTKKIKLFDYATVVKDTLDIHYPIVEMECQSKISCLSWSNYYKSMMASSDYEGAVTVWDAFTNKKVKCFQEHEKRCWSVDFNRVDTKLIASGSDDAKVKLWATNTEHSVINLEAKANVCCVKFTPSSRYSLAFGSADHCVHYYDLRNTKQALNVFKGHKKAVSYVKFLNDNELVSASTDSQLKLWSTAHQSGSYCQRSFVGHINEKNFVGLATDGEYIACGSENNSLYVYYKGLPKHALAFHFDSTGKLTEREKREDDTSDFVSAVCWRSGSNVLVAANSQGIIKILELV